VHWAVPIQSCRHFQESEPPNSLRLHPISSIAVIEYAESLSLAPSREAHTARNSCAAGLAPASSTDAAGMCSLGMRIQCELEGIDTSIEDLASSKASMDSKL